MHVMYFVEKVLHSKIVLKNICLMFICVCKYVVNILFLGHNFIVTGKKGKVSDVNLHKNMSKIKNCKSKRFVDVHEMKIQKSQQFKLK